MRLRSRAGLGFGAAAALLLASAAAAAGAARCESRWQEKFLSDWDFTRERWNELCAAGRNPADSLRAAQDSFIKECVESFAKTAESGLPAAMCAQGKPGRARLAAMTGVPSLPGSAPAGTADAAGASAELLPPGRRDMGPLLPGLKAARERWRPDACFSGLHYTYVKTNFIAPAEWERARRAGGRANSSRTYVEQYSYVFTSPGAGPTGFRVSYGDQIESAFCSEIERMKGPDAGKTPLVDVFGGCLRNSVVGLSRALVAAKLGGSPGPEKLSAYLGVLPGDFYESRWCSVRKDDGRPRSCAAAGLDARKLGGTIGTETWIITADGSTSIVSARDGRVLARIPSAVSIDGAPLPALYGYPCSQMGTR